jgi:hypothetical protein
MITGDYVYEAYTWRTGTRYFSRLHLAQVFIARVFKDQEIVYLGDFAKTGMWYVPGEDAYIHRLTLNDVSPP